MRKTKSVATSTTIRECLNDPKTREQCVRRIIRGSGLHVTHHLDHPLALPDHRSRDWSLPQPPVAFHGVAGVILDRQRTRIIATVMQDGTIQKLQQPLFLPPELAEDRPEVVGIDSDILRATLNNDASLQPKSTPRFTYSRPLMGGRMPVVTPATHQDLHELYQQVQQAPPFVDESSFHRAIAHARDLSQGDNKAAAPTAYTRGLVKVGSRMIPILDTTTQDVEDTIADDLHQVDRLPRASPSPSHATHYNNSNGEDDNDDDGQLLDEECVGC